MEKHLMFGDLEYYQKPAFAEKHHTGTLMIPGKKYPLKIFAAMTLKSDDPYVYDPSKYKSDKTSFLDHIQTKAIWMRDDQIQQLRSQGSQYGVLTMSTCSASQADERTVVLAMYKK